MAWARMRREPGPGPEVRQSAPVANLHEFGGVGRLHAVRLWLDQHSEDGTKVRMSSAFLGHVRACPGFADARRAVVRLSSRDCAITLPGHAEHPGDAARRRAENGKRRHQHRDAERWRDKCPTKVGTGRGTKAGPDKIREEKEGGGGGTNLAGESKEPPPPELAARGYRKAERWRDKCPTKVGTGRGTKAGPDKIREEKEGGGGTNLAGESNEPPPPELPRLPRSELERNEEKVQLPEAARSEVQLGNEKKSVGHDFHAR